MCQNPQQKEINPSHFEGSTEEKVTANVVDHDFMSYTQGMKFFDPHMHMSSRTTDDYQALADAGVVALIEPAILVFMAILIAFILVALYLPMFSLSVGGVGGG